MLISEAVELVIQAGSVGKVGETFLLDMGAPVTIATMAHNLIFLMGKKPGDEIRIEFTGSRPGEKLREELLVSPRHGRTEFPDLRLDSEDSSLPSCETLETRVRFLSECALAHDLRASTDSLRQLVPEWTSGSADPARGASERGLPGRDSKADAVASGVPHICEGLRDSPRERLDGAHSDVRGPS